MTSVIVEWTNNNLIKSSFKAITARMGSENKVSLTITLQKQTVINVISKKSDIKDTNEMKCKPSIFILVFDVSFFFFLLFACQWQKCDSSLNLFSFLKAKPSAWNVLTWEEKLWHQHWHRTVIMMESKGSFLFPIKFSPCEINPFITTKNTKTKQTCSASFEQ